MIRSITQPKPESEIDQLLDIRRIIEAGYAEVVNDFLERTAAALEQPCIGFNELLDRHHHLGVAGQAAFIICLPVTPAPPCS